MEIVVHGNRPDADPADALLAEKLSKFLQPDIKRVCLTKYLAACIYKHALAFFQWRERFAPNADRDLISAVFAARVSSLRKETARIDSRVRRSEGEHARLTSRTPSEAERSGEDHSKSNS